VKNARTILALLVTSGIFGSHAVLAQQATPSRAECFSLHEKSQVMRNDGKLLSTRQVLRSCSSASCPSLVVGDCVRWLEEVERQIPTVVFEATYNDKDIVNVKVTEGDKVLAESMTGTPVEFDPGAHKIKAETPDHPPALESTYVVREGEKARVIRFNFGSTAQPHGGGPVGPRPVPGTTFVFGGAAIVAAAAGGTLGFLALKKKSDLDALKCKPLCTNPSSPAGASAVTSVKNMALYADIGFGVGVVAAGLATVFYLTRPVVPLKADKPPPTPGPGVKPEAYLSPNMMGLGLGGSF